MPEVYTDTCMHYDAYYEYIQRLGIEWYRETLRKHYNVVLFMNQILNCKDDDCRRLLLKQNGNANMRYKVSYSNRRSYMSP